MPTILATAILGAGASTFAIGLLSFAISYVVSSVFAPDVPESQAPNDGGVKARIPSDPKNKLPVVYGQSRIAGQTIFADISADNQKMAFIIALSEGPIESITDVWWQDKKLNYPTLDSNLRTPTPTSGTGGSTGGAIDQDGKAYDFLDSDLKISVFPGGGRCLSMETFSSRWNTDAANRTLPNMAYAFVELTYNRDKGVTGLPSKLFFLVNGRTVDRLGSDGSMTPSSTSTSNPVDCLIDYLTNETYGGSIPIDNIDTASMYAHKTFCDELKDYTSSHCTFPSGDTLNGLVLDGDDYNNEVRCIQQFSDQG